MKRANWEDVSDSAGMLGIAGSNFVRAVLAATENPALQMAAEHVGAQVERATRAGKAIATLMHKLDDLADFESGRVTRNSAAP